MFVRKSLSKKKPSLNPSTNISLDSSLTSIEWLPKMQIGENPLSSSTISNKESLISTTSSLPITLPTKNVQPKIEPDEKELPISNVHLKPPFSYVTLIRQAIMSTNMQRMTLNEIYQWIIDSYPYFRAAPPKWKNSIRHNLSLNKCFKRLQRNTNDPGKGSYWAIDETNESNHQINSCKRKPKDIQSTHHILPSSPSNNNQQSNIFCMKNNSMIYGGVRSIDQQSTSTDESDSTVSLTANSSSIQWADLNIDLTASCRLFCEKVLDSPSTTWITETSDAPSTSTTITNSWGHDVFPYGEANSFFENVKLGSNGEINWNDVDVKPYCEFFDGFRANSTFQQQDRDKLLNLASSISSFIDCTSITNLAQTKNTNESITTNRIISDSIDNFTSLPVVIEDEAFDWESIT